MAKASVCKKLTDSYGVDSASKCLVGLYAGDLVAQLIWILTLNSILNINAFGSSDVIGMGIGPGVGMTIWNYRYYKDRKDRFIY